MDDDDEEEEENGSGRELLFLCRNHVIIQCAFVLIQGSNPLKDTDVTEIDWPRIQSLSSLLPQFGKGTASKEVVSCVYLPRSEVAP